MLVVQSARGVQGRESLGTGGQLTQPAFASQNVFVQQTNLGAPEEATKFKEPAEKSFVFGSFHLAALQFQRRLELLLVYLLMATNLAAYLLIHASIFNIYNHRYYSLDIPGY